MKISIGSKIIEGPWGGGNLFVINLKNYLISNGHEVVHHLEDDDIDIILMTSPNHKAESSSYGYRDVYKYIKKIKRDSIVVHRINECDERKGTKNVNEFILNSNKVADATIFVSSWIESLYLNQGFKSENSRVILSGSDKNIFNQVNQSIWDKKSQLKIVTHHWGNNWNKGFEIYSKLDNMIYNNEINLDVKFTYIGNVPKNFKFKKTTLLSPLSGVDLAKKLKNNHIYLTASLFEPSGNHHIEGAQCGLPVLFINSGGLPEYCNGYGVMFDNGDFINKLEYLTENYEKYLNKVREYPRNSETMSKDYLDYFEELLNNKNQIIEKRNNIKLKRFIKI
tara:strand:+ start:9730 stop:10740 length:1011 start_codon:yes stop_codon:yes gene_type:complete